MSDAAASLAGFLERRVTGHEHGDDEDVAALLRALRARFGDTMCAVLLYGSYLRGSRDTLLDFYVVVDDYGRALGSRAAAVSAFLMPPNVYYLCIVNGERELRAKYAVVSRRQLQRQVRAVHPYFWARLTQPCGLVYARDAAVRRNLLGMISASVETFVSRVAPTMSGTFDAEQFWNRAFGLTYRAELRAEGAARVASLFAHDAEYYSSLLALCATGKALRPDTGSQGGTRYTAGAGQSSRWIRWYWAWTIALGKLLSVARLVKGAVTFNDPIDYILWKVERHSGIRVEATERQRKYPLIFAWPLAWRLFRLGAFR